METIEVQKLSHATTHIARITAYFTATKYRVFMKQMSEQFGTALQGQAAYTNFGHVRKYVFNLVYSDCDSGERLSMIRNMPGIESADLIE